MSKRKGMSLEEKRKVVLAIYHESKDVMNLKEIESLASKKGVVQQSVKDVNQGLCDDGLVDTDKIGAGNFYWSFVSSRQVALKNQVATTEGSIEKLKADIVGLKAQKEKLQEGRVETEERKRKYQRYLELKEQEAQQQQELQMFSENDPEELERLEKLAEDYKNGFNRWLDNSYAVQKYLVKKFNCPSSDVQKLLEMNDSLDYIS